MSASLPMKRKDDRIIVHFDYDCFYASVFEAENPKLKSLPLAVQQKQIIVTCNYEARRRGLHKLQLIRDAKRICPDVIIVLGEDLTRFRDASKALYRFLRSFSTKAETLGFDEVFIDVTELVDYNMKLLNHADLAHSFFCLRTDDPTLGFQYDASRIAGPSCISSRACPHHDAIGDDHLLLLRLVLGSHLANHMRTRLVEQTGYTAAVGISTSKLLSKLVGNVNKPNAQTTLVPPYSIHGTSTTSNVQLFMDQHDIGKIPYVGFKMSHKLRAYYLQQHAKTRDVNAEIDMQATITAGQIRTLPGMSAKLLDDVLAGPGMPRDVGHRTWCLLHGIDNSEVSKAKDIPKQISIEDSYIRLDHFEQVRKELLMLSTSLIRRMRTDLTETSVVEATSIDANSEIVPLRWLAYPKTLRLSTRPRPPPGPDGTRARASHRISRSAQLPPFVFHLTETVECLATKLTEEHLLTLFRSLHPEKQWDLSLLNIAVTNFVEVAGTSTTSNGRDISNMFSNQEKYLQPWKVKDVDTPPDDHDLVFDSPAEALEMEANVPMPNRPVIDYPTRGSEDRIPLSQTSLASGYNDYWDDNDEDEQSSLSSACPLCGARMPDFAMPAHLRFHETDD